MKIIRKNSPNQNERKNLARPCILILHYTGTKTMEEADQIYMTPDQVSPHYMIDRDGSILQYVDEDKRSWHAGKSSWDGFTDINSASIGIEIVNGGHEFGLEPFSDVQIKYLIDLIKNILLRWDIPAHYILGHSDIAPGRKIDPGEHFPWGYLHKNGIGLMPDAGTTASRELPDLFRAFGYDYANDLALLKTEFCRHYMADKMGSATETEIANALQSLINQKLTAL